MRFRPVAWASRRSYGPNCGSSPQGGYGSNMRRVIAIAVAGASLGGCSSFSVGDYFKSTPPAIQVQLESQPPGADAKTSLGPGCKTPCSVSVPAPDTGFSVTYLLPQLRAGDRAGECDPQPRRSGDVTDPNPVFAELRPAGPPPRAKGMKPKTVKKKPKPAAAARPSRRSPIRTRHRRPGCAHPLSVFAAHQKSRHRNLCGLWRARHHA